MGAPRSPPSLSIRYHPVVARYASPREPELRSRLWRGLGLQLAVAAAGATLGWSSSGWSASSAVGLALLLAFVIGVPFWLEWARAPRGFSVDAEVRVERRGEPLLISLWRIRSLALLPGPLPAKVLRRASGSCFGYHGWLWGGALGWLELAATRRRNLVVVDTEDRRYLLSPEPVGPFVEEVLGRVPEARLVDAPLVPHPKAPRDRELGTVGVLASLTGLAALVLAFAVAPIPRSVSVGQDAIAVSRWLAGDVEISLDEVISVEPLSGESLSRLKRVAGHRWPRGLAWGEFSSEALGRFRMFASREGPYVLAECKFGKVVLTPEDPRRFVDEVRLARTRRETHGP